MSAQSKIEWTQSTWNPVTGCTKISAGCKNCYAERMALRLKAMGNPNYANGFNVTLHEHLVNRPLTWKKSKMIFVNSMSDLFHNDIPDAFILDLFSVMEQAHWHTFQVLTKRSQRMLEMNDSIIWPKNVWLGVTVENIDCLERLEHLKQMNAKVKFISFEPLISKLTHVDLYDIDWVIVGGESGPGARPIKEEWILDIKNICSEYDIPFFFKQWGGVNKKKNGRTLLNKTWDDMPVLIG